MNKRIKLYHILFRLFFLSLLLLFTSSQSTACSVEDKVETTQKLWISELKWQDPSTLTYLGSPSLVKLENGNIIASFDYFGRYVTSDVTSIYKSTDNGLTWEHLTDLKGMFWATLFAHKESVYLLGTSAGITFRSIVIMKSDDEGKTWTTPTNGKTGVLFSEGLNGKNPLYHCAPTPVLEHNGRIYKAFENLTAFLPGMRGYNAFAISADVNSDLLQVSNWIKSTEVVYPAECDPKGSKETTGWIEGNIVEGENGKLWNIMRINSMPFVDVGALIEIKENGKTAEFSSCDNFIHLPGGMSKFVIRKDAVSGLYFMLTNNNTNSEYPNQRNILSLYVSKDLREWIYGKTLMKDESNIPFEESVKKTGFQYPDWQFDGDDIIYLSRTSYDGAVNYHNSNRITFGRLSNFRNYIPKSLIK